MIRYLDAKEFFIMNIPYEMFLTIQLVHLTCRKIAYNRLQEKVDETCSKEQVTTVQEIIQNKNSMTRLQEIHTLVM